jgi:hypothetical protein
MENSETESNMYLDNSDDLESEYNDCLLCQKMVKDSEFPKIIHKALARKYCSNLNDFFYTKDVNKILNKNR